MHDSRAKISQILYALQFVPLLYVLHVCHQNINNGKVMSPIISKTLILKKNYLGIFDFFRND